MTWSVQVTYIVSKTRAAKITEVRLMYSFPNQPQKLPVAYPPQNLTWVQRELAVSVNSTANLNLLGLEYPKFSGDVVRRAGLKDIEYLLETGVKVTLIYGDRDQR